LPDYKVGIECQGIEHFEPRNFFGGNDDYISTNKRDKEKKELCATNGIKLIYYTNLKNYHSFLGENLIKNENLLLEEIKKRT
jgi:hypothetical protein